MLFNYLVCVEVRNEKQNQCIMNVTWKGTNPKEVVNSVLDYFKDVPGEKAIKWYIQLSDEQYQKIVSNQKDYFNQ